MRWSLYDEKLLLTILMLSSNNDYDDIHYDNGYVEDSYGKETSLRRYVPTFTYPSDAAFFLCFLHFLFLISLFTQVMSCVIKTYTHTHTHTCIHIYVHIKIYTHSHTHTQTHTYIYIYKDIHTHIYITNPSAQARCDATSIYKWSLTSLNLAFSFF